ncbi:MAG: hypothetical protein ACF8XB_06865, partial [Planctomycetota bacterium JB042]
MDAESGPHRPRRRLLLPGAGLAVAALLAVVVLGRAEPDVRFSFERFELDTQGSLVASYRLENLGRSRIEAFGGRKRPVAILEVPDPSDATGWSSPALFGRCGTGLDWHVFSSGDRIRLRERLDAAGTSSFRLRVPARRAAVAWVRDLFATVGLDDGEFDLV